MDIATIAGVIEAVKTLTAMTKATADAIGDEKQREKLYEIRQGLMDLQARVLDDQISRMELVSELDQVRQELAAEREKKAALADYELAEVAAGRFVYRSKSAIPAHFSCPNCRTTQGLTAVLQVQPGYGYNGEETRYWCTACQFDMFV